MTTTPDRDLRKLQKAVAEAVRRGIDYDDWMSECILRVGSDTNLCSRLWDAAVEEDQRCDAVKS